MLLLTRRDIARGKTGINIKRAHYFGGHRGRFQRLARGLDLRLAQRNANHGSKIVGDNALPSGEIERAAGVGEDELRIRFQRVIKNRVRNSLVIEQRLAFGIAPGSQSEISVNAFHEDVSAFAASQFQSDIEKRHQDFVEHADRIQLAGGFEEQSQLFQIGSFIRNMNAGNLA